MGDRRARALRLIPRLAVLLLLGAVVNVAVAWRCAEWAMRSHAKPRPFDSWAKVQTTDAELALWMRHAEDGWPGPVYTVRAWNCFWAGGRNLAAQVLGPSLVEANLTETEIREKYRGIGSFTVSQFNGGVPLQAWRIEQWSGFPEARFFSSTQGNDAEGPHRWDFPRHVIWPGFAINTLFYAGILWLLFAAPFALRRRRRIKRGLCPACAYPVGASTICTECGKPVKARGVEPTAP